MPGIDREGRTPLHYAALANDADAASQLLTAGANPNVPDRLGFTPLHFAAQEGALAAAGILLAAGAQVDAVNSYGNTPLAMAVFNSRGRGELIQLLRRHGADPRHPNNSGQTPVGTARLIANYNVGQFFADPHRTRPNDLIHRARRKITRSFLECGMLTWYGRQRGSRACPCGEVRGDLPASG